MIAVDLSKQQALDADSNAIPQINFTANLERIGNTRIYFILEEEKENVLDFSQGTVKVFVNVLQNTISLNNLIFASIKWRNTAV